MNLYDIKQMYTEALEGAIDSETGEIIEERLVDLLTEIEEAKEIKCLNIAKWIKNLESESEAIKAEEKRLKERRDKATKKAESLTQYLQANLSEGETYKDSQAEIKWRKSPPSVEITCDVKELFDRYPQLVEARTEYKPIKADIKKAIQGGDLVLGCGLRSDNRMVII